MATEGTQAENLPNGGGPSAAPSAPSGAVGAGTSAAPEISQEEYLQLKDYYDRTRPVLEKLSPYADDINWMTEAQENAELIRTSRKLYEDSRKAREPELDPAAQALIKRFEPALSYVDSLQKREVEQVKAQQADLERKVRTAADALTKAHPWLAEHGNAGLSAIAAYGDKLGITDLTEAANAYFAASGGGPKTPPRSLRAEGGSPGVPGPSSLPPIKSRKDIAARLRVAFSGSK